MLAPDWVVMLSRTSPRRSPAGVAARSRRRVGPCPSRSGPVLVESTRTRGMCRSAAPAPRRRARGGTGSRRRARPSRNACTGQAVDDASSTAPRGSVRHRLLVAEEHVEGRPASARTAGRRGPPSLSVTSTQPIGSPYVRSTVPPRRAAEHADAVAGAEEREVRRDDPLGERRQLGLGPPLRRRLLVVGVADVERAAAEQDPGPGGEVDLAELVALEPVAAQVALLEPAAAQHRVVLVCRRRRPRRGCRGTGTASRLTPAAWTAAPDVDQVVDSRRPPTRRAPRGCGRPAPPGRCGTAPGVRLNRGAGAGWVTPSCST